MNMLIYKGTHEVIYKRLPSIFNARFNLSCEEISQLIQLWVSLKNDNTNLRVKNFSNIIHIPNITESKEKIWSTIKDEYFISPLDGIRKIESVNEDYYDKLILKNINSNYSNASNIVANIICDQLDNISDSFLFYRLVHLIKGGYLSYTGNINSMRDLKVRLNN